MTNAKRKPFLTTRELATVAILAAISAVLFMIEIPVVLFYKLDLSHLPVLLGTFAMGPVPGTLILLVKSLLGLLHSSSQGVGELADFLMGFAMLLPAGLIYQHNKTRKGALIGMAVGTVVATIVAVLSNLYIMIPFYGTAYGMPVEAIVGMGTAMALPSAACVPASSMPVSGRPLSAWKASSAACVSSPKMPSALPSR